jgi:2-(1,2-epoxy-1,2-dihydrophenyl)acetyl-CoA isomerase
MRALLVHRADAVVTIELNRPERLNALDRPTRRLLLTALTGVAADPDVRAVVLTGAGRAFCVGQDLSAVDELVDTYDTVARSYNPLIRSIVGMDKPVIAAVNGLAVGAGMGLVLACDVVVMADSAGLACAFGKMALVPDTGTSWFLARRVGHVRAFEIAMTGRTVPAPEALALGLVNRVLPRDRVREEAARLAAELAGGPEVACGLTKRLLISASEHPLEQALEMEAAGQARAAASEEHVARRTAFLGKS